MNLLNIIKDRMGAINPTWEERVTQLEQEGLTRSDAQGAVDVEILEGWRPTDFQPWMLVGEASQ